jgi:RNA polymerase sigma factor for flagellar operon FliA
MVDLLARSIDELSERERLVLKLYYVEELNLKEIGAVLEVTESRVSQILSGLTRKLRAQLQPAP